MTDDLMKRLRRVGEGAHVGAVSEDRKAAHEAADRIERLEASLLNIIATFRGSSSGAYKAVYFRCLQIAKAELKHLGLGGTYTPYVQYRDRLQVLEKTDD
jgi:hypothetical protein